MEKMYVILAKNIRDALPKAVNYIMKATRKYEKTRIGEALVAPGPVTIRYDFPKQQVLINPVRDANPFFHLMEAMWMLAGRNDGEFLDHYVKDFSKKFGNKNGIIPDAYGYRWRQQLGYDQLHEIIKQLKEIPLTRQAVLQMWDDDLVAKDPIKPCNLVATFRIRGMVLDMTVFNRSNDLIWGCCGANAVHFPVMQEYVASMVGLNIGKYWQISTNLHLYKEHINMLLSRTKNVENSLLPSLLRTNGYEQTLPLVKYPESFDNEVQEVVEMIEAINQDEEIYEGNFTQPFLKDVVLPMARAHRLYKKKEMQGALARMEEVIAEDWKRAGIEWIKRRIS
jgi:thymidylate synthase